MMVLLATLQGNGSASTLTASSISSEYKRIIVKGTCRVTGATFRTPLWFQFSSSSNINSFSLNSYQENVTTWGSNGWNNLTYGRGVAEVPGSSADSGRMLNFELDIPNRNVGLNKLPIFRASVSNSASGPQWSEVGSFNLQSTSVISSLSFTTEGGSAWSTNTVIHVYGIK